MTFLDELEKVGNETYTQNGALTNKSSLNNVLDYFALAGAMRNTPDESARLFEKAYFEAPLLAVRCLFYLRDIRGGQGERDVFYAGLSKLAELDKKTYNSVLPLIPEYGRWDDLFINGVTEEVVEIVRNQFNKDNLAMVKQESVSLLAKWLPSENASSKKSRAMALELASGLGISPRQYRKLVVKLRSYISILEQKMSANQWSDVEYSKVPSQAFRKHTKAFVRHDDARFNEFLSAAEDGEVKLNTSTLYTYEVYKAMKSGQDKVANAMWVNLPDYTNGKPAMVIADVSGSMTWTQNPVQPIDVSVSLALYFAERNEGPFKNYFMTFSTDPQLVKITGKTLKQKFNQIDSSDWGGSTNLQSAFDAILDAAVESNATKEEIPAVLYIISDMEFNVATSGNDKTNLQSAKDKFEAAGYELPHVVFWNVDAKGTQLPATKHDKMVTMISGYSQSTFRYAVEGKTPMESMMDILNSDRYSNIVI